MKNTFDKQNKAFIQNANNQNHNNLKNSKHRYNSEDNKNGQSSSGDEEIKKCRECYDENSSKHFLILNFQNKP